MKWQKNTYVTRIERLPEQEGESIEEKLHKVTTNKEPIDNIAPLVYTDRKDGVLPQYDVRTDRFEIARQAMDRISATRSAMAKKAAEAAIEDAKKGKIEGEV